MSGETINRGLKKGWMEWMKKNPVYFKDIFGDMTLEEAWEDIMKIKRDFMELDNPGIEASNAFTLTVEDGE